MSSSVQVSGIWYFQRDSELHWESYMRNDKKMVKRSLHCELPLSSNKSLYYRTLHAIAEFRCAVYLMSAVIKSLLILVKQTVSDNDGYKPSHVKLQSSAFAWSALNKQVVHKVQSAWVISGGMRLEWAEGSYLPRVWIKNQSAVSTSLTLRSYTDLRCSFDLIMFLVSVEVEWGEGAGAPLWCCNAKCLLSLAERSRPGRLSKNSIRATLNVSRQHKRRREARRCERRIKNNKCNY